MKAAQLAGRVAERLHTSHRWLCGFLVRPPVNPRRAELTPFAPADRLVSGTVMTPDTKERGRRVWTRGHARRRRARLRADQDRGRGAGEGQATPWPAEADRADRPGRARRGRAREPRRQAPPARRAVPDRHDHACELWTSPPHVGHHCERERRGLPSMPCGTGCPRRVKIVGGTSRASRSPFPPGSMPGPDSHAKP
jgi:hypothetical protein